MNCLQLQLQNSKVQVRQQLGMRELWLVVLFPVIWPCDSFQQCQHDCWAQNSEQQRLHFRLLLIVTVSAGDRNPSSLAAAE